jgi:excisionase family DNA binding protein
VARKLVGRFSALAVNTHESRDSEKLMSTYAHSPGRPHLTREDVLDGREVADLLHMPLSTVLEYARRGLLPARKLGRRWIFLRDEIESALRGDGGDSGGKHVDVAAAISDRRPT